MAEAQSGCTITGTAAADVLTGTPGDDVICGLGGNDLLRGRGGEDRLLGGKGQDRHLGGAGDDHLRGDGGNDVLRGGAGRDTLRGGAGADLFAGGPGPDLGDYVNYGVAVNLSAGNGAGDGARGERDDIRGDVENLRGGSGDDSLLGTAGANMLRGHLGGDTLRAGAGDDHLYGGDGSDALDARDSAAFTDHVICGDGGGDRALADTGDRVGASCENLEQNRVPTDIILTPATVAENAPASTTVGTLSATDPDTGETHTFGLVAGAGATDNGSFTIAGSALRTNAVFDYETKQGYSVRVQVTDGDGASFAKSLSVSVTNLLENLTPVAVDDAAAATEDVELQLPVSGAGSPAANDTDADGDPLTVSVVSGATGGTVAIVSGSIRFQPTANLCGAAGFDYTVSDGRGGTDLGRVAVTLACTPDDPTVVDDTATVDEDDAATTIDVLANDDDPDGDPVVDRLGHTGFERRGRHHQRRCRPDVRAGQRLLRRRQLHVHRRRRLHGHRHVKLTYVNDAPVVTDQTFAVAENSANGTAVGTVAATDQDAGQTKSFAITGGNTGGAFAINATTGAITVATSSALDFETTPSFALTVTVTDNGTPALADTATVTVTLTNVNEAPAFTGDPYTFAVNENSPNTTAVGTVTATDPDAGQTKTFAITAGTPAGRSPSTPPPARSPSPSRLDFETTPSFTLTVTSPTRHPGPLGHGDGHRQPHRRQRVAVHHCSGDDRGPAGRTAGSRRDLRRRSRRRRHRAHACRRRRHAGDRRDGQRGRRRR